MYIQWRELSIHPEFKFVSDEIDPRWSLQLVAVCFLLDPTLAASSNRQLSSLQLLLLHTYDHSPLATQSGPQQQEDTEIRRVRVGRAAQTGANKSLSKQVNKQINKSRVLLTGRRRLHSCSQLLSTNKQTDPKTEEHTHNLPTDRLWLLTSRNFNSIMSQTTTTTTIHLLCRPVVWGCSRTD